MAVLCSLLVPILSPLSAPSMQSTHHWQFTISTQRDFSPTFGCVRYSSMRWLPRCKLESFTNCMQKNIAISMETNLEFVYRALSIDTLRLFSSFFHFAEQLSMNSPIYDNNWQERQMREQYEKGMSIPFERILLSLLQWTHFLDLEYAFYLSINYKCSWSGSLHFERFS